ncbi:hypothetical protein [Vibrio tubiashii]|uniref:hypothetical protein n=1 Tax=Vibrio tubiashii TaxID=29498 RepID=UPI00349E5076
MVRSLTFLLVVGISLSSSAKSLNNSKLYDVPDNEQWRIISTERSECNVCTSDVYVQNGSVRINGVWVSGTFDFSFDSQSEFLFDRSTIFALGDVVKTMEVSPVSINKK